MVTHILGSRNTKNGVRYKLKYRNGSEEYTNESDAKLDCKKFLNQYTKKGIEQETVNITLVNFSDYC